MDFRNMNKFNDIANTLSGNFFPMTEKKTNLGFIRTIYLIFTWIIELIYLFSTVIGLVSYVPAMVAIREGGVSTIVTMEVIILVPYLNSRHDRLRNLIGKINNILINSDDLKQCIHESVTPHKERLKIYMAGTVISVMAWAGLSMVKILGSDRHSFTYTDFALATYYPGAPFTVNFFILGVLMQMAGCAFCTAKKNSMDVYVSYLTTLVTAEYRYVQKQITDTLGKVNAEKNDESVIASLRKCIQHHCLVIEVGQMLTEALALNAGLTYLMCILRCCFVGFSAITLPDIREKFIYISYMVGTMIQIYMFCLCGQELVEASTTVTDEAFYENWYERGNTVKKIFRTMGLGNKIKCRLSAFQIVDLTVPTFSSIINQAYSICLLLMKMY